MSRRPHGRQRGECGGPRFGRNAHQHATLGDGRTGRPAGSWRAPSVRHRCTSASRRSAIVRATARTRLAPRALSRPPRSAASSTDIALVAQRRRPRRAPCHGAPHWRARRARPRAGVRLRHEPRPPRSTPRTRRAATGRHRGGTPRPEDRNGRAADPTPVVGIAPAPTASTDTGPAGRPRRTGTGSSRRPAGTSPAARLERAARATRITPSSSGCRSASSTAGWNSPSSSRKRTPPCASADSPGRMALLPPPTSDTLDAPWCGARNGGRCSTSPPAASAGGGMDARVASRASSPSSVGKQAGQPPGQHRLARAGRPDEKQVVTAGGRDLEGEAGQRAGRARRRDRAPPRAGSGRSAAATRATAAAPISASNSSASVGTRRAPCAATTNAASRCGGRRHDDCTQSRASTSDSDAGNRRIGAVEAELADERQRLRPLRRGPIPSATSSPTAMARSRPAPTLRTPDGARLTVIRLFGQPMPRSRQRGAHPVARLTARGVGQADDA